MRCSLQSGLVVVSLFVLTASSAQQTPDSRVDAIKPITKAQAEDFARRLEESVSSTEGRLLGDALHLSVFWSRITRGLADPDDPQFAGLNRGKAVLDQLGEELSEIVRGNGSYRLLRVVEDKGRYWALFRLLNSPGLNYHHIELGGDQQARVRILDIRVALTGENLSATLRRVVLPWGIRNEPDAASRLTPVERALIAHQDAVGRLASGVRRGLFVDAMAAYEEMPTALRKERAILIMAMLAANQLMTDGSIEYGPVYTELADELARLDPDDPALHLFRIDYYLAMANLPAMRKAVEDLDRHIGGDFYLDYHRGVVATLEEQYPEAEQLFEKVRQADPTLVEPYYALVDVAVSSGDYSKANQRLMDLKGHFDIALVDFSERGEAYEGYMKSKFHREWIASLENRD